MWFSEERNHFLKKQVPPPASHLLQSQYLPKHHQNTQQKHFCSLSSHGEGPSFTAQAPATPPSPTDPQAPCKEAAALTTALTPGRSGDVDWGRRVVVSVVPAPQKLRADTQSACPTQGLNASNLQQRELPAGSTRVSLAVGAQRPEALAAARQDPRRAPWGHPGQDTTPFRWPSTSSSAQAHPDTFYRYKYTPVIPATFWHRTDSQLVACFRKGGLLHGFGFQRGNHQKTKEKNKFQSQPTFGLSPKLQLLAQTAPSTQVH